MTVILVLSWCWSAAMLVFIGYQLAETRRLRKKADAIRADIERQVDELTQNVEGRS